MRTVDVVALQLECLTDVIDIHRELQNNSITAIPAGLFANNTKLGSLYVPLHACLITILARTVLHFLGCGWM